MLKLLNCPEITFGHTLMKIDRPTTKTNTCLVNGHC